MTDDTSNKATRDDSFTAPLTRAGTGKNTRLAALAAVIGIHGRRPLIDPSASPEDADVVGKGEH